MSIVVAENFCTFHADATWLQCPYCASMRPFWHPLLSNGLVATEFRRAFCPLSDLLVQSNKGLSKNLAFILFIVASSGRKQTPQEQKANPSGKCFKHQWHWTVLDICPNSNNSMLPISCGMWMRCGSVDSFDSGWFACGVASRLAQP